MSDWVFLLHSSIVLWVHANDANGQKLLQIGGRREEKRRKGLGIRRYSSLYSLLQKTAAIAASLASCWVCLTQRRRQCALSGWGPRSL